jgi:DNA-binding transcriptional MerR regulator
MEMRMQELATQCGLSKTKIHHYLREGLLPPAQKSARNASLYGPEHLERLNLIAELRGTEAGELSIPQIRAVLAYMSTGMAQTSAVRLVVEGVEPEATGSPTGVWEVAAELAAAANVSVELVHALEVAHLIRVDTGRPYSAGDLLVARACESLCGGLGVDPSDLTPLVDLIREVGDYSDSLAELYSSQAAAAAADSVGIRSDMRDSIQSLLGALLWRAIET